MNPKDYEIHIWASALRDAEAEVLRYVVAPAGGRLINESLYHYVERARKTQLEALEKFQFAEKKLAEVRAKE